MIPMEASPVYRTLTIKYDMANDRVEYDNPDGMTYLEILGLIKYAEMQMTADVVRSDIAET